LSLALSSQFCFVQEHLPFKKKKKKKKKIKKNKKEKKKKKKTQQYVTKLSNIQKPRIVSKLKNPIPI
jgi:hypothetical protein